MKSSGTLLKINQALSLIALVIVLDSIVYGQTPTPTPTPQPSPLPVSTADPADVATIDAIVASLYNVISGPPGKRNWDRFRSLFYPGARLIPTGRRQTGEVGSRVLTPEDYIERSAPSLEKNGFFEREISRRTERFGNIAHLFSTYESRHKAEDEKPFARGINSIQMMNDGKRWWIVTVFWQGEDDKTPLPAEYLKSSLDPQSKPQAFRLDSRIPRADQSKYLPISGEWQNPNIFVSLNNVFVSSKILGRQKLDSADDLGHALLSLPVSAWPLGRVVTFSQSARIPLFAIQDPAPYQQAFSNLKRAREILQRLGIDIVDTPVN